MNTRIRIINKLNFRFFNVFFAFVALFACSSCGYGLQGSGSILPPDVKTVAILPVENLTTESAIELSLTEKLRSRFERYGVVEVVDEDEPRDAELATKVLSIDTTTRNTTGATDISLELDLVLTVEVELRRTSNGKLLYRNPFLVRRESFAGVSDVVVTSSSSFSQSAIGASTLSGLSTREVSRGQQEEVLEDLLDEVARSIYLNAVAADF